MAPKVAIYGTIPMKNISFFDKGVKRGQTEPNGSKMVKQFKTGPKSAKLGKPGPNVANQGQLGPTRTNWIQSGPVKAFIRVSI